MGNTDNFVLVEASKLTLEDNFLQFVPKTSAERAFKRLLIEAIQEGVKDFWRPKYDPSLDAQLGIVFEPGKRPGPSITCSWWRKTAKKFNPKRKSRLGTEYEYFAFLGVLIKRLIASGWSVEEAWDAVCNDSKKLGNYANCHEFDFVLEPTGSREICGFADLGNTMKILTRTKNTGYWLAGGFFIADSCRMPLSYLVRGRKANDILPSDLYVGWVILEN